MASPVKRLRSLIAKADGNLVRAKGGARLNEDKLAIRRLAEAGGARFGLRARVRQRVVGNRGNEVILGPANVDTPIHLRRPAAQPSPAKRVAQQQLLAVQAIPNEVDEPDGVANSELKRRIELANKELLNRVAPEANVLGLDGQQVPDTEWHDFHRYVYLRQPRLEIGGSHQLHEFLARTREALWRAVFSFVERAWRSYEFNLNAERWEHTTTHVPDAWVYALAETLWQLFLQHAATDLYDLYARSSAGPSRVMDAYEAWLHLLFRTTSWANGAPHESEDPELWIECVTGVHDLLEAAVGPTQLQDPKFGPYTFAPFAPDMVNFGLQLTYRQEWKRLGNQTGPIIRTIPLGPKQSEKVTIKRVVTSKLQRGVETLEATETTRESATTEKDSSEVVAEAARSMNWEVKTSTSAEMKGSVGIYSGSATASLSAGAGGQSSSNSRNTKQQMNEAVEKTASRTRNETKLSVDTERASTDELTSTSEIVNPNEEIAVTYVYSRLYRKYEVHSYLAEANSVIFVPEPLPNEITEQWIRDHAWILAPALLDDSFRDDLAAIVNDPGETDADNPIDDDVKSTTFEDLAKKGTAALGTIGTITGQVTLPDVFSGAGQKYIEQLDKQRTLRQQRKRQRSRSAVLRRHIADNILHYMRAIWNAEDPQQRMQRYATRLAPAEWVFVPETGAGELGMTAAWPGEFVPVASSARPVSELIDPAGPIDYVVNYAVFRARADASTISLNRALGALRAQYVRYVARVEMPEDAERVNDVIVLEPHWNAVIYTLAFDGGGALSVHAASGDAAYDIPADAVILNASDKTAYFEGLCVCFDEMPADADYEIELTSTGELQDPELPALKVAHRLPSLQNEAAFFDHLLQDMRLEMPRLGLDEDAWDDLDDDEKETVRRNYHEYLMKKDHTRRFVLDTNSVTLDLEVGKTPALEDFKRLHRSVDVAKALEEYDRERLENVRRARRVDEENYADPDIDRLTVVAPADALDNLVGPELLGGDDG